MPNKPQTLIFDLGGVYFSDGVQPFIANMEKQHGLTEEQIRSVLGGPLGHQYRTDAISADEFWDKAKKEWNIQAPSEELAVLWHEGYQPIEGTVQLIDRLREALYPLFFLSDNTAERITYLEKKFPFLHRFNGGIFSHVVKIRKPDPQIYQAALDLASAEPAHSIFIDDKDRNLPAAKALGISTILFTSPAQLEQELRDLGLEF